MANAGALISLAASYEKCFGRASLSALGELARQYSRVGKAVSPEAMASAGDGHEIAARRFAAPIIAHLLDRIFSLKWELMEIVAHHPDLPPANCAEPATDDAQVLAEQVDATSRLQIERGDMPPSKWIRQKVRQDMLAMSEQALRRHLEDLVRIRSEPLSAVTGPAVPGRSTRESEADYRQLMNEVEAALHIGWLLQEEFSGAWAHADTESMLLAKMTPFERGQYEVRKDNARRRQEFRRKNPEIYSLDASRRQTTVSCLAPRAS
jgi:hypothetical protein